MNSFLFLGIVIVVIIICLHIYATLANHSERKIYYKLAVDRATNIGRPLVVIGDPVKGVACGLFGAAHGYGDVCVDIDPADGRCLKKDALSYLKTLESNSCVLYTSCVLEYVDKSEIDEIVRELYRVTGSHKNLFVVHVKWYAPTAYLYRFQGDSSNNVVMSAPPVTREIEYFKL